MKKIDRKQQKKTETSKLYPTSIVTNYGTEDLSLKIKLVETILSLEM